VDDRGTIEVTVGTPLPVEYCDWQIFSSSSSTTPLASGEADYSGACPPPPFDTPASCPLFTFAVTGIPAGSNYLISCSCPSMYTTLGPCTDGETFSLAPQETTQVEVNVACPG